MAIDIVRALDATHDDIIAEVLEVLVNPVESTNRLLEIAGQREWFVLETFATVCEILSRITDRIAEVGRRQLVLNVIRMWYRSVHRRLNTDGNGMLVQSFRSRFVPDYRQPRATPPKYRMWWAYRDAYEQLSNLPSHLNRVEI